jgi:predicted phage terminase large subunit-like protein
MAKNLHTSKLSETLISEKDIKELDLLNRALEYKLYELSLREFVRCIWPIIETENPFTHNWHIDAICDHLEAVTLFQIPKLIINIPPRMLKSIIVSVAWPAWVWLRFPERRFLFASYAQSLSTRDAVKMRLVISSDKYRAMINAKNINEQWKLTDDQNQKMRFDNTKNGFRYSTSVGGMLTGEGGDYLAIDDPHHALEVHSEKRREEVINWYKTTFSTRANNPKRIGRVVIMQRLHSKDLSGYLLEQGDWEHLVLPMHFSQKLQSKTRLSFKDPREKEGELLFPERFGEKEVKALERDLGENATAQIDQNPVPASGGTFKREWWQWYRATPKDRIGVFQFVDCAQKPGLTNDYSVVATWLETLTGYYILDVVRGKFAAPDLERWVKNQAGLWNPHEIVIEDKSAGSSLIQNLQRETVLPIKAFNPTISKELRAIAATPTVAAKNVYLPEGAKWVEAFILEHELFPNAENDDQVDTTSMAIDHFINRIKVKPRMTSL